MHAARSSQKQPKKFSGNSPDSHDIHPHDSRPGQQTGLLLVSAGAGLIVATLAWATRGLFNALGAPRRQTRPAPERTRHFDGTEFRNTLPATVLHRSAMVKVVAAMVARGRRGNPPGPIPLSTPKWPSVPEPLAATWLGHATVLLEIDGHRILTDPVFGERVSPSAQVGPLRLHPAPLGVQELPQLDAVVISHDHYDHLEVETIRALVELQQCPFLVPLGIAAHLRRWGVPEDRIIELDWDEAATVAGLTITCTEARHFSGRLFARNTTLWASWALSGPAHRVFFGGDTGYTPAFAGIGARFGPFDLTLLPIGAYDQNWPDIHLDPQQALQAHGDLGGRALLPIHWATFDLAFHSWAEPVERLLAAAPSPTELVLPMPGQRWVPGQQNPHRRWWTLAGADAVPKAPIAESAL